MRHDTFSVLLIEEKESVARSIGEMVTYAGYEVIPVWGMDLIDEALHNFEIDLILIAFEMPSLKISGEEIGANLLRIGCVKPLFFMTTQNIPKGAPTYCYKGSRLVGGILEKPFRTPDDIGKVFHEALKPDLPYSQDVFCESREDIYYTNDTDIVIVSRDDLLKRVVREAAGMRRYRSHLFDSLDLARKYVVEFTGNNCIAVIDEKECNGLGFEALEADFHKLNPGRVETVVLNRPVSIPDLVICLKSIALNAGSLSEVDARHPK